MNKKVKKEINETNIKINEINQKIDTLMNRGLIQKADRCDFLEKNLKNVKLRVSKIKPIFIESNIGITIEYQISPVTIYLDGENIISNEIFKSINMLDLISYEDMSKIQRKIEDMIALQKRQS